MFGTKMPYNLGVQPRFLPYGIFMLRKLYEFGFSRTSDNAGNNLMVFKKHWYKAVRWFVWNFHIEDYRRFTFSRVETESTVKRPYFAHFFASCQLQRSLAALKVDST